MDGWAEAFGSAWLLWFLLWLIETAENSRLKSELEQLKRQLRALQQRADHDDQSWPFG